MIEDKLLHVFPGQMVLSFHLNLVDLYLNLLYRVRGCIRERLLATTAVVATTSTTSFPATTRTTRHYRLLRRDHLPS